MSAIGDEAVGTVVAHYAVDSIAVLDQKGDIVAARIGDRVIQEIEVSSIESGLCTSSAPAAASSST